MLEQPQEIKRGDIVYLRSGSHRMTVTALCDNLGDETFVQCSWFEECQQTVASGRWVYRSLSLPRFALQVVVMPREHRSPQKDDANSNLDKLVEMIQASGGELDYGIAANALHGDDTDVTRKRIRSSLGYLTRKERIRNIGRNRWEVL